MIVFSFEDSKNPNELIELCSLLLKSSRVSLLMRLFVCCRESIRESKNLSEPALCLCPCEAERWQAMVGGLTPVLWLRNNAGQLQRFCKYPISTNRILYHHIRVSLFMTLPAPRHRPHSVNRKKMRAPVFIICPGRRFCLVRVCVGVCFVKK